MTRLKTMTVCIIVVSNWKIAAAAIPEPDAILYGTARFDGALVTRLDDVTVVARVAGAPQPVGVFRFVEPPLTNCVPSPVAVDCNRNCIEDACDLSCAAPGCAIVAGCGSSSDVYPSPSGDGIPDECPGDNYVLRIRLETLVNDGLGRSPNAALIGETVSIFLKQGNGPELHAADVLIAQRGMVQNLSLDTACGIAASTPENCSIDPLQPHLPGAPASLLGTNSLSATFGINCSVPSAVPADFTVSCTPPGPGCPSVSTANLVGQVVTITFGSVIPAGRWTCVTHTGTSTQVCIGSLPGDVDGNRAVATVDISAVADHLKGIRIPPLPIGQCDIDRSGLCTASDLVREIDLLNGASQFQDWIGKTLQSCPSPP